MKEKLYKIISEINTYKLFTQVCVIYWQDFLVRKVLLFLPIFLGLWVNYRLAIIRNENGIGSLQLRRSLTKDTLHYKKMASCKCYIESCLICCSVTFLTTFVSFKVLLLLTVRKKETIWNITWKAKTGNTLGPRK